MFRKALFLLPALMATLGVAHAGPITVIGSAPISTSGTSGVIAIGDGFPAQLDLPLTVGVPDTLTVLDLTPDPHNGTRSYNFTVGVDFSFTTPGLGSFTDQGTGSVAVHGNQVTSDTLSWADGAFGTDVTFSNGDVLNVNLSDVDASDGSTQAVTATFDLVSDSPTPVPEPASLVLLGGALVALGLARRRLRL